MGVTTTTLFDVYGDGQPISHHRHEFEVFEFQIVRNNLRNILFKFWETDDFESHDIADRIQHSVSEWLTVPSRFDDAFLEPLSLLGELVAVEARWGKEIRLLLEEAQEAGRSLCSIESPMRAAITSEIEAVWEEGGTFRIFCHRKGIPHFETLLPDELKGTSDRSIYLHSLRDLLDLPPIDRLFKVGPLRSRGWGATPDAIVTAPRFSRFEQFTWRGCNDEAGFGFDPVASLNEQTPKEAFGIRWVTCSHPSTFAVNVPTRPVEAADDLQVFREMGKERALKSSEDRTPAIRLQIDNDNCVFHHPHTEVMCFDPAPGSSSIESAIPVENLRPEVYILRPLLADDVDLGELSAKHGHYTKIWKDRLIELTRISSTDVCSQLRARGVKLVHLESAIEKWCAPPTTVIRSPQQMRHFQILVEVLGLENTPIHRSRGSRRSFWESAWDEIRQSRGEAIQEGTLHQQIVRDQLALILQSHLQPLRSLAAKSDEFSFEIPPSSGLCGDVFFNKVYGLDKGYRIPKFLFGQVLGIHRTAQWLS